MGIIMGALGGLGEAAGNVGASFLKAGLAEDQAKQDSDLALNRAMALETFKNTMAVNTANQQRDAQVGRINSQAGIIADQAIGAKRDAVNAGIADPSSWTSEQQAAVDQSLGNDKTAIVNDPRTRMQAAELTGDIDPKAAATLSQGSEITQMKMQNLLDRANDRNQTMKDVADVRAEALKYGYELRLQAAQEKAANGKIDTATGRMLITSEDVNIKAATTQLGMLTRQMDNVRPMKDGKPNPDYEALKDQMEELRSGIKDSQAKKDDYLKSMNVMPGKSEGRTSAAPYPEGTVLDGPGGKYVVKNGVPVKQ